MIDKIHHRLYARCREKVGKEARPTACIIDAQSVKSAEKGGSIDTHGYDAGKKIKGKKRHALVDTQGLLMKAIAHPAEIQDCDGGLLLLSTLFGLYPFLKKFFADGGCRGPQFKKDGAELLAEVDVEIVKRSDAGEGFEVPPQRWIVERTIAWLNRRRRLAKDFENGTHNALAFLELASIRPQSSPHFPPGCARLAIAPYECI